MCLTPMCKPAVLKLGVATLLRVDKFQKWVAKLWNWEIFGFDWSNMLTLKLFYVVFSRLEGHKAF